MSRDGDMSFGSKSIIKCSGCPEHDSLHRSPSFGMSRERSPDTVTSSKARQGGTAVYNGGGVLVSSPDHTVTSHKRCRHHKGSAKIIVKILTLGW